MDPPPKRMRMDTIRGLPDMGHMTGGGSPPFVRPSVDQGHIEQVDPRIPKQRTWSRASSACQTCRGRKTKCDNDRPICGYCRRVGATCTYIEDSTPAMSLCQSVGPRLLGAIENLTNLIQRNEENFRAIPQLSRDLSRDSSDYPDSPTGQGGRHENLLPGQDGSGFDGHRTGQLSLSDTAGLDSVLEWPIFPKPVPFAIDPFSHASPRGEVFSPRSPPAMEFYELSRLIDLFLANVHPMNPVIDASMLRQMLKQVAENGPDWSAATCLVALTCALGAISQRPGQRTPSGTPRGYSVEPNRHLASRYWSVAEKRLGFSMGQPGWESVQCLCLAGIWHMYNMDPLQAWKCFSMASNTWYTTALTAKMTMPAGKAETPEYPQSLSIEQTLYFTCFKSESELAFELSLPGSILAGVDYPYSFPSPPTLGVMNLENKTLMMEQRSWYYYIAEISARRLMNRIVHAQKRTPPHPTEHGIDRMLEVFEVFDAQLTDWYESLPPPISFQIPNGDVSPLADDICQMLRGRYLVMRELLCRPFVQLASTISIGITVSEHMVTRVAEIASRGLQYCLLRIQAVSSTPHHGLWLQLRGFVTCSLILTAAERAQTVPSLNMPSRMVYPQNWKRSILAQKEILSNCWEYEEGGISDCARVLDWALAKFSV
ncbi:C6 transcription factor [Colletotrichum truncatum]|uniref:C6 transcription factor n=1 Tax=Colletotrichum truncatum TaxID=5467 RepID=A0ACC3YJY7_COLTU